MAKSVGVFGFDVDIQGATVTRFKDPLCPRCASDGEIDEQIALLKHDLDAVAKKMKAAIREQRKKPTFRRG